MTNINDLNVPHGINYYATHSIIHRWGSCAMYFYIDSNLDILTKLFAKPVLQKFLPYFMCRNKVQSANLVFFFISCHITQFFEYIMVVLLIYFLASEMQKLVKHSDLELQYWKKWKSFADLGFFFPVTSRNFFNL